MAERVTVSLPDGSRWEAPSGVTVGEIAAQLDPNRAKDAVVARLDGRLVDLTHRIEADAALEIVPVESEQGLEVLRHSTAHVMAQAVKRLWPEARLAIGPPIADGFYYDFDLPVTLSQEDLARIEAEMARIVQEDYAFHRSEMSRDQALRFFADRREDYKVEILEDLEDEHPSIYSQGEFIDLCRGPHVPSTGRIKAFKLRSVAGAYWRGDASRPMLQRIYGTAFPSQEQLDRYLQMLEEAARRDHRRLGRELDLFSFREEAPGFVFWHPRGQVLYRTLVDFSRRLQEPRGYQEVATPWIFRARLWETSGHWEHYRQNMFLIDNEGEAMGVKPMNCPAHCLLYKDRVRSYRDLPIKISEYGPLSRLEASGTLHGALRVRGMHQDDAHLFVREDQIEEQIQEVVELVDQVYRAFDMPYVIKLSTRPEDFMGEIETWNRAEAALERALKASGRDYRLNPGDGAFYGPKLDLDATDALGRTWQCATIQLDLQLPERFDLTYVDADGRERRPVMIHRAIMGTLERFIGILVEHFAGAFPTWLAPVQVRILPVGENHMGYARQVGDALRAAGLRAEIDGRDERVGYKIREAQVQKIPYMLVVGGKEEASGTVAVRHRSKGDLGVRPLPQVVAGIGEEVRSRSAEPLL